MPLHALANADTLLAVEVKFRRPPVRGELVSPVRTLQERLGVKNAMTAREIVRDVTNRATRLRLVCRSMGQHQYQGAVFAADQARSPVEWTASTLAAGWYRLELELPARIRQWRWRARCVVSDLEQSALPVLGARRTTLLVRKLLPMLVVLGATVACSLVAQDGGGPGSSLARGPLPELSKSKSAIAPAQPKSSRAPWSYVLSVDHGIRSDDSGEGHFRAPRFHGEHNGLDLLAPIGTPVFSPCAGQATAGVSRSFGTWARVICPVPDAYMKKGGPRPWVSFFYAHLETADLATGKWVDVAGAQAIGKVGKSGNARGSNVQPHLHLELIVQRNQRAAMDERHLGSDQSSAPAADFFADALSEECMAPYGFEPKSQLLRRARRLDPFVALTCLGERKPNFVKAPSPLAASSLAWTRFYVARDFNVNLGVEDSLLARRD